MFQVGNQIIVKSTKDKGYIYSIIDDDLYCIHIVVDNKLLHVKMMHSKDIELKPCKYGNNGLCNYSTNGSRGMFACMYCELDRE